MTSNPLPMGTSATCGMAATVPGRPRESVPTPNPTGLISAMAAAEHGCVDWYLYPLPVTVHVHGVIDEGQRPHRSRWWCATRYAVFTYARRHCADPVTPRPVR